MGSRRVEGYIGLYQVVWSYIVQSMSPIELMVGIALLGGSRIWGSEFNLACRVRSWRLRVHGLRSGSRVETIPP